MTSTASSLPLVGINEQFPEFHGRLRFDKETKKASVIDVIKIMTGQPGKGCSMTMKRLQETHPELGARFEKIRINSKV